MLLAYTTIYLNIDRQNETLKWHIVNKNSVLYDMCYYLCYSYIFRWFSSQYEYSVFWTDGQSPLFEEILLTPLVIKHHVQWNVLSALATFVKWYWICDQSYTIYSKICALSRDIPSLIVRFVMDLDPLLVCPH